MLGYERGVWIEYYQNLLLIENLFTKHRPSLVFRRALYCQRANTVILVLRTKSLHYWISSATNDMDVYHIRTTYLLDVATGSHKLTFLVNYEHENDA